MSYENATFLPGKSQHFPVRCVDRKPIRNTNYIPALLLQ